jgi:hypothetical protein
MSNTVANYRKGTSDDLEPPSAKRSKRQDEEMGARDHARPTPDAHDATKIVKKGSIEDAAKVSDFGTRAVADSMTISDHVVAEKSDDKIPKSTRENDSTDDESYHMPPIDSARAEEVISAAQIWRRKRPRDQIKCSKCKHQKDKENFLTDNGRVAKQCRSCRDKDREKHRRYSAASPKKESSSPRVSPPPPADAIKCKKCNKFKGVDEFRKKNVTDPKKKLAVNCSHCRRSDMDRKSKKLETITNIEVPGHKICFHCSELKFVSISPTRFFCPC